MPESARLLVLAWEKHPIVSDEFPRLLPRGSPADHFLEGFVRLVGRLLRSFLEQTLLLQACVETRQVLFPVLDRLECQRT